MKIGNWKQGGDFELKKETKIKTTSVGPGLKT